MSPMFRFLELPVPPQAAGVDGTLNCYAFCLYHSGILSTTVLFFYLKDAILFLQGLLVLLFAATLSRFLLSR